MTGQFRYYDGLVHYLAMLHLSGNFKIWKPKPSDAAVKKTVETGEYNGVKYDKDTTFQAFEGCKLYDVTVKAQAAAPVDTSVKDTTTTSVATVKTLGAASVRMNKGSILIENVPVDTKYIVTDFNGRVINSSKTTSTTQEIRVNNKGAMLVIVGNKTFKVINK